jgi:hypothetical protein
MAQFLDNFQQYSYSMHKAEFWKLQIHNIPSAKT